MEPMLMTDPEPRFIMRSRNARLTAKSPVAFTSIDSRQALSGLGELGVVFLLFLIGLELSFERLMTMRHLVFGLGGLQVILTTIVLALLATWLGHGLEESIILGTALSLTSTAMRSSSIRSCTFPNRDSSL